MGKLIVGEYTYGEITRRGEANNITIGKFCSIAQNVVIDGGFNHETKYASTFPFKTRFDLPIESNVICKGDVKIGNDVWICENVLIMSGVTIYHGAVIGANSIVTKDVAPYTIVAGSPAKEIKKRFEVCQVIELLKIKWWDWEIEKIKENAHLLNGDLREFLTKHKTDEQN